MVVAATVATWAGRAAPARAATPTDVMFVFDTSGSMNGVLEEAVAEIEGVMARIDTAVPEVEYGVAEVRDFGGSEYDSDEFDEPWHLVTPITNSRTAVNTAIDGLFAEGGGDGPEAYGRALWETDTNPFVGWRSGARHAIVLVADNVPHMPDVDLGMTEPLWLEPAPWYTGEELPGTWGIPGSQLAGTQTTEFLDVLHQLAGDGKPLEMVDYHDTAENYIHYWEYWAALAGGHALEAGGGGKELAGKLISLIESAAPPCAPIATPTQPSPHPPSVLPAALTPRFGLPGSQVTIIPVTGTRFCPGQRPAVGGAAVAGFEELTPAQMTFRVPPTAAGGITLSSPAGVPGPAAPYEVDNFRFPWGFAVGNSGGNGGGRTYDAHVTVTEDDLRSVFGSLGPSTSTEYKQAEQYAELVLNDGLCYGFSLFSKALYGDSHGPQSYSLGWANTEGFKVGPSTAPYSLREKSSGAHGLTHALLRAAVTQFSPEARHSWQTPKSAKAVAADLAPAFQADQPAMLMLWFEFQHRNAGHTVLAFNEQTVGDELVVDVVDPNVPWTAGSSPTDYEALQVHVRPDGSWHFSGSFSGTSFADPIGGKSGSLQVVTAPPTPGGLSLVPGGSSGSGTVVEPGGDGTISAIGYGASPGRDIPADVEPAKTYVDAPTEGLVVPADHNTFTVTVKSKGQSSGATVIGPGFIDSADVPAGESDITVSGDSGAIGAPSAPAGTTLRATTVTGEVQQAATVTFYGKVTRPRVTVGQDGGVTVTTAGGRGRASIKLAAFAPGHESRAPRQIVQIKGRSKLHAHTPKVKHHKAKRKHRGHPKH